MKKEDYQQFADKDCKLCGGKGYVLVEDLHLPDEPEQTRERVEWCECALENYESVSFIKKPEEVFDETMGNPIKKIDNFIKQLKTN